MEAVTILIGYVRKGCFVADMHNFDLFCHIPPFYKCSQMRDMGSAIFLWSINSANLGSFSPPCFRFAYLRFKDWRDFRNAIPVVSVASSFEICLLSGFWNAKFGKSMSGKCSRCLHICNVFKVEDVVRRSWEPVAIKAVMVVKACAKTPSGKIQNETFGKYVVLWVGNILERQNGSHWKMCNTLKVSLQWQTNLHQFNVLFTPCLFYHAAPQRQYIKKQNYILLTFH